MSDTRSTTVDQLADTLELLAKKAYVTQAAMGLLITKLTECRDSIGSMREWAEANDLDKAASMISVLPLGQSTAVDELLAAMERSRSELTAAAYSARTAARIARSCTGAAHATVETIDQQ